MQKPVTIVFMQLPLRNTRFQVRVSGNQPRAITQPSTPRSLALNWPYLHHLLIDLAYRKVFSSDINKLKINQITHTSLSASYHGGKSSHERAEYSSFGPHFILLLCAVPGACVVRPETLSSVDLSPSNCLVKYQEKPSLSGLLAVFKEILFLPIIPHCYQPDYTNYQM